VDAHYTRKGIQAVRTSYINTNIPLSTKHPWKIATDNGTAIISKIQQSNNTIFSASDASLWQNRATNVWGIDNIITTYLPIYGTGPVDSYPAYLSSSRGGPTGLRYGVTTLLTMSGTWILHHMLTQKSPLLNNGHYSPDTHIAKLINGIMDREYLLILKLCSYLWLHKKQVWHQCTQNW
jgi:hypothetical protein